MRISWCKLSLHDLSETAFQKYEKILSNETKTFCKICSFTAEKQNLDRNIKISKHQNVTIAVVFSKLTEKLYHNRFLQGSDEKWPLGVVSKSHVSMPPRKHLFLPYFICTFGNIKFLSNRPFRAFNKSSSSLCIPLESSVWSWRSSCHALLSVLRELF